VPGGVLRTKADCLRVCTSGPIAVVYPDGTWYRDCTLQTSIGLSRSIWWAEGRSRSW